LHLIELQAKLGIIIIIPKLPRTPETAGAAVYNQQVTDSLTESFIALAKANGIPVVGVYETMPEPGYDYQSWMLAEVQALRDAVANHVSTEHL
jgi:zinc/manganese transport system substrate-binding protein